MDLGERACQRYDAEKLGPPIQGNEGRILKDDKVPRRFDVALDIVLQSLDSIQKGDTGCRITVADLLRSRTY